MKIIKQRQGFTLIEILIVVAIIAILASVVLIGLGPTQQAGRDARRVSDLREVQTGLELYYSKCGYYPGTGTSGSCANAATTGYAAMSTALLNIGVGVSAVPLDPTNSAPHVYGYATTGASATGYLLSAVMENANGTVFQSYTALPASVLSTYKSGNTVASCAAPTYCVTL